MNLASWKLHGPVRTLRTEHAEWDSGRGEWQAPRGSTIVTFRPDGQVSETESHNSDGSIRRCARTCDDAGRMVVERAWKSEATEWEVICSYDALGRVVEKEALSKEGRFTSETCRYDDAGRHTKAIFLPSHVAGSSFSIAAQGPAVFPDDARQLPTEISLHDASGGIVSRVELSRDAERRLVTEVVYLLGESLFGKLLTGANEMSPEERAGILAVVKTAIPDDVFCRMAYAYDSRGRLTERTTSMGTLSEERCTFEYQDRVDAIAETTRTWENGVEAPEREQRNRYDYQYDSRGNWTERIVSCRNGAQGELRRSNVERRTIGYYE